MSPDLETALRHGLRKATDLPDLPVTAMLAYVRAAAPRARRNQRFRAAGWTIAMVLVAASTVALVAPVGRPGVLRPAPPITTTLGPATPTPAAVGPVSVETACPSAAAAAPVHEPAQLPAIDAAYTCTSEERTLPDGSTWQFTVAHRITGGLPALLAAYAEPDEAAPTNEVCTAIGYWIPSVFLQVGGAVTALRPPRSTCGKPLPSAIASLKRLVSVVAADRKDRMLASALATSSGCSQEYKDMLAIAEAQPARAGSHPKPLSTNRGLTLCSYQPGASPDDNPQLVRAIRLKAGSLASVNAALVASRADPSCSTKKRTGFAVFSDESGTYLAVGGCAVQQGSRYWRASPALVDLLTAQ